ncbi:FMN-binding protein [Streptococcus hyovaginalis]
MKKKLIYGTLLFGSLLTLAACGSDTAKDASKAADTAKSEVSKKAEEVKEEASEATTADLKDGTYTAESDYDSRGWKVVHTITVADGKITESDFGYENEAGEKKADDEEYNKNMKDKSGVSSKEATEKLNQELVDKQNVDDVEVVSGATSTSSNFELSTKALIKAAQDGNTDTVTIELPAE